MCPIDPIRPSGPGPISGPKAPKPKPKGGADALKKLSVGGLDSYETKVEPSLPSKALGVLKSSKRAAPDNLKATNSYKKRKTDSVANLEKKLLGGSPAIQEEAKQISKRVNMSTLMHSGSGQPTLNKGVTKQVKGQ